VPVQIKPVNTADERAKIYALRHAVFVGEQHVPEEVERDALDGTADHVIAVNEQNLCVGTGRLVVESDGMGRVGRMAVHPMWRNRGIGRDLLLALERIGRDRRIKEIVLNAQVEAEPFYARNGYLRVGEPFTEAGILHVEMKKRL
jgi:predicted GNAT family N-acyltransferase